MDTIQNSVVPTKDQKLIYKFTAFLICGLVVGLVVGYFVMKYEVNKLEKQIVNLQDDLIKSKVTPTPTLQKTSRTIYQHGVNFVVPNSLGDNVMNEAIIPLGAMGNYSVRSILNTFNSNPSIRIITSTDSIVYENFIQNGTLAITPNSNTLTPGTPNLINGLNFCSRLAAKVCTYDENTNTATFEKEYKIAPDDKYTVSGAAHFFNILQTQIGSRASVVITRVISGNPELIQVAKDIALSAKN